MSLAALVNLLERLEQGDDAAAEEVFRAYAPYLRMVVRRHLSQRLRSKFDSLDVVQSVWADLLRGFRGGHWRFKDPSQLRAFLIRATHNRFLNRVRRHQHELDCEQLPADGVFLPSADPRPSEVAQANELWQHLLDLCPPAHRDLLRLKREGLPLGELAARTGLHPSSVRRILYDLERRVEDPPVPPSSAEADNGPAPT